MSTLGVETMSCGDGADLDDRNINIMLLGKTGHGKSSTGNTLLMRSDFRCDGDSQSVTSQCQSAATRVKDGCSDTYDVNVLDTRGLCDTAKVTKDLAVKKILWDLEDAMSLCTKGVDCFMLILKYGARFTEEEEAAVDALKAIFSEEMFEKYMVVVFTHKSLFELEQKQKPKAKRKSFGEWCHGQTGGLADLLALCKHRCVIFENMIELEDDAEKPTKFQIEKHERQRRDVLQIILCMREENKNRRYASQEFNKAAQSRYAMIEKANMEVLSPDILNRLGILRDRMKDELSASDLSDHEQILKVEEIKCYAQHLLRLVNTQENKCGFLDGIKSNLQDFVDNVDNKSNFKEYLAKLEESDRSIREVLRISKTCVKSCLTGSIGLAAGGLGASAAEGLYATATAATAGTAAINAAAATAADTAACAAVATGFLVACGSAVVGAVTLGIGLGYRLKKAKHLNEIANIEQMSKVERKKHEWKIAEEEYKKKRAFGLSQREKGISPSEGYRIMKKTTLSSGQKLIVCLGDVIDSWAEAIVHPTDAQLSLKGETSFALQSAGGEELAEELTKLRLAESPLAPSSAVLGCSYTRAARTIHVNIPMSDETDALQSLSLAVKNILVLADAMKMKSLALPALGSGCCSGFSKEEAARAVLSVVNGYFSETFRSFLKEVDLVLKDMEDVDFYQRLDVGDFEE